MDKSQALRRAFGRFATGVAVVTTCDRDNKPIGLTINSFSSVSLEPPLVLWSLVNRSPNLDVFRNASHFAINILANGQQEISNTFARPAEDRFANLDWHRGIADLPVIAGVTLTGWYWRLIPPMADGFQILKNPCAPETSFWPKKCPMLPGWTGLRSRWLNTLLQSLRPGLR